MNRRSHGAPAAVAESTTSSVSRPLLFLGWPEGRGHPGGPGPALPHRPSNQEGEDQGQTLGWALPPLVSGEWRQAVLFLVTAIVVTLSTQETKKVPLFPLFPADCPTTHLNLFLE